MSVEESAFSPTASPPRASRLARGLALLLVIAGPIAIGAAAFYAGATTRLGGTQTTPTPRPTWIDQEFKYSGTGTILGTLRCTYHLADGTTRVYETPATGGTGAATPRCPASAP